MAGKASVEEDWVSEAPTRPSFGAAAGHDADLDFLEVEGETLEDILRQPPINLEYDQQYNSELPSPLKPEQYFHLNWALEEDRQQLTRTEE